MTNRSRLAAVFAAGSLLVIFLSRAPEPRPIKTAPGALPELVVKVRADLSVVLIDEDVEVSLAAGELPAGLRAHLRETTHAVFVEFEDEVIWDHVVSTIATIRGVATSTDVAVMVRPEGGASGH